MKEISPRFKPQSKMHQNLKISEFKNQQKRSESEIL